MKYSILLLGFLLLLIYSCKDKDEDMLIKADYSFTPDTAFVGDTVFFNTSMSTNTKGVNEDLKYSWDFNTDGFLEIEDTTENHAFYVYNKKGTYTARLQLTDGLGGFSIAEKIIPVIIHPRYFKTTIGTTPFIADEFSVDFSNGNTTITGLKSTDSSYLKIIHLGQYQTGTFSVMNGEYFDGNDVWSIVEGQIKFFEFDSITNVLEGEFGLELDAVSGSTVYASEGEFYLDADDK